MNKATNNQISKFETLSLLYRYKRMWLYEWF